VPFEAIVLSKALSTASPVPGDGMAPDPPLELEVADPLVLALDDPLVLDVVDPLVEPVDAAVVDAVLVDPLADALDDDAPAPSELELPLPPHARKNGARARTQARDRMMGSLR
jgi:hypothetical protein